MSGKLCVKQPSKRKTTIGSTVDNAQKSPTTSPVVDISSEKEKALDTWLDDLHLPDAAPGQHFHVDFGFVRGSEFSLKLENGKTITSIDGKNAYLLIVDRATRMLWIYVTDSKSPPVDEVPMILEKFGSKHIHRTIHTDQDKALGKSKALQLWLKKKILCWNSPVVILPSRTPEWSAHTETWDR